MADPANGPDAARATSRILVVGLPRSGTSWVGRALSAGDDTGYVSEPDNEDGFAYAVRAKRGLGYLPAIAPGQRPSPSYQSLWAAVLGPRAIPQKQRHRVSRRLHRSARGASSVHDASTWPIHRRAALAAAAAVSAPGPTPPKARVVVKSVYAALALRWIRAEFSPAVVIVVRDALNTVSSWRTLGWGPPLADHPLFADRSPPEVARALARIAPGVGLPDPPSADSTPRRLTWELSALLAVMLDETRRDDGRLVVVSHAALCAGPHRAFRGVLDALGVAWDPAIDAYLDRSDQPGESTYGTTRVAAEEPGRWRTRLSAADAGAIRDVADSFDIPGRFGVQW